MIPIYIRTVLSAAILAAVGSGELRAQALATPARTPGPPLAPAVVLRSHYELRLSSAWPAPPGESRECNNRATETLAGSLRRVAEGRYEGRFRRRTRLGFCGTHGPAVKSCGAVLHGEGDVGVVGEIAYSAGGRPTMTLVWQPVPGTTRVRVDGNCAVRFAGALERMYRDAVHSVDFAIPDEGPHRIALEDYGRTLQIR